MIPHHLLALLISVVTVNQATSILPIRRPYRQEKLPDFWWDYALDHNALIGRIVYPLGDPSETYNRSWNADVFAKGVIRTWRADKDSRWTFWHWSAKQNSQITGGGFVFNETGEVEAQAGVNWLFDSRSGAITWNCFAEGNDIQSLHWDKWLIKTDNASVAFVKTHNRWGFQIGDKVVVSKHCASGSPSIGKRYKYLDGVEVETSVTEDPFNTPIVSTRRKRSPESFWEKVKNAFKDLWEKIKKFFSAPEGKEGQCNPLLNVFMKVLNLILGRKGGPCSGDGGQPGAPGGQPGSPGGQPPAGGGGGGEIPERPEDAEELDPKQNEAIRDWE